MTAIKKVSETDKYELSPELMTGSDALSRYTAVRSRKTLNQARPVGLDTLHTIRRKVELINRLIDLHPQLESLTDKSIHENKIVVHELLLLHEEVAGMIQSVPNMPSPEEVYDMFEKDMEAQVALENKAKAEMVREMGVPTTTGGLSKLIEFWNIESKNPIELAVCHAKLWMIWFEMVVWEVKRDSGVDSPDYDHVTREEITDLMESLTTAEYNQCWKVSTTFGLSAPKAPPVLVTAQEAADVEDDLQDASMTLLEQGMEIPEYMQNFMSSVGAVSTLVTKLTKDVDFHRQLSNHALKVMNSFHVSDEEFNRLADEFYDMVKTELTN